VPVVGIGRFGLLKRRGRSLVFAKLLPNFSERKPGGGEAGRKLGGLQQQIGGGGKIAPQLQIARKVEPPVGHQIAGGQEYSRWHWAPLLTWPDDRELFRKMDTRVKPAHDG
jgi:hypothetical protein